MNFVKAMFLLLFCFYQVSAFALNELAFDKSLLKKIDDNFYTNSKLDLSKLTVFREKIIKRIDELSKNITIYDIEINEKKDVELDKDLFVYKLILNYLAQMPQLNVVDSKLLAKKILDLDYASKLEGSGLPVVDFFEMVESFSKNYVFDKEITPSEEATNLFDTSSGLYYDHDDLTQLHRRGVDLSTLEPAGGSDYWSETDIEGVDVEKIYTGGQAKYFEGLTLNFPEQEAKFKKVRKTQSKPKVDITIKENGVKQTFKLKFGAEIHSEISAGSLAATLGFHFDPSKYVRDFKVVLPKKMKIHDFKKEWNSYFLDYDVDSYIKEVGKTKKGKTYIIFKEALIETKPDDIVRVGPWGWGSNGHRGLREVRAQLLFNMWISNLDLKESGNNKLALRDNGNNDYDFYYYQHDLGFSFGRYFREKPIDFLWNPIHSFDRDYVRVHFRSFQKNSGFEHVTYSDARWMIRKIARLSRAQIQKAIELGGWPSEIGILLTEKLISRRNHFVKSFDLSDEFEDIEFERNIETKNKVLNNGVLTKTEFEGFEQNFDAEYNEVLRPIYKGLEELAVKGAIALTSSFDTIEFDSETLGLDSSLVAGISVSFDRDVDKNLKPTGKDDAYLTQDTMTIYYKFGGGVLLSGEVSYAKEYKIVYPVRTKSDGLYHNNFIFNALLPYHIRKGKLPKNYVLILSDTFEGAGELILNAGSLPLSIGLEKSIGKLSRTVIAKKNKKITFYKDKANYDEHEVSLYADLLFLRLPVWKNSSQDGALARRSYTLDLKTGDRDKKLGALDDVLRYADIEKVRKYAEKDELLSNYVLERNDINIFEIFDVEDKKRVDELTQVIYTRNGDKDTTKYLQIDVEESTEWSFLGDGELKLNTFKLLGKIDARGRVTNPRVEIRLVIEDRRTITSELSENYIRLINRLALNNQFIMFSPDLYSRNGEWGSTNTFINMEYNQEAIDKVLNKPIHEYYEMMEQTSDADALFWKSRNKNNGSRKALTLRRRFQRFLKNIKRAQDEVNSKKKYEFFIDAMSSIVWKDSGSFNYLLLQRVNSIIGGDNYFLEGIITMPEDKEMKLPAKTPLYNIMNKKLQIDTNFFEFDFREPDEAWDVLYR